MRQAPVKILFVILFFSILSKTDCARNFVLSNKVAGRDENSKKGQRSLETAEKLRFQGGSVDSWIYPVFTDRKGSTAHGRLYKDTDNDHHFKSAKGANYHSHFEPIENLREKLGGYSRAKREKKGFSKKVNFKELMPLLMNQPEKLVNLKSALLKYSDLSPIAFKEFKKKYFAFNPKAFTKETLGSLQPLLISNPKYHDKAKVNLRDIAPLMLQRDKPDHRINLKDIQPLAVDVGQSDKQVSYHALPLSVITPLKIEMPARNKDILLTDLQPLTVARHHAADLSLLSPVVVPIAKESQSDHQREDAGTSLYAVDGHMRMPGRLSRYMKLLVGKDDRNLLRRKPYVSKDVSALVLLHGGRPRYEIDKLSRYIDKRRKRLLARRLRKDEEDRLRKRDIKMKKLFDDAAAKQKKKLKVAEKIKVQKEIKVKVEKIEFERSSIKSADSTLHSIFAHANSAELNNPQNMVDMIKREMLLRNLVPYATLQV